jgi:hypothetical protein
VKRIFKAKSSILIKENEWGKWLKFLTGRVARWLLLTEIGNPRCGRS